MRQQLTRRQSISFPTMMGRTAIVLAFFYAAAAAATTVTLPSQTSVPAAGSVAAATAAIQPAAGETVLGGSFAISFDPAVVAPASVDISGLPASCIADSSLGHCTGGPQNGLACSNDADCPSGSCVPGNQVLIAFGCSDPLPGTVSLATITFQGVSGGSTGLAITQCNLGEGSTPCTTVPGSLAVNLCGMDVDTSSPPASVATDVVYIARSLLGLPPVPGSFRTLDPNIPPDSLISANVDAEQPSLDVDGSGSVNVATDVVYIARRMLGLPPVPTSFRTLDPTIPSDAIIGANVDGLCQ